MTIERSPYTPSVIDSTLREWPKWVSLAEGLSSSLPDAHRHPEGGTPDPLRHADRVADVSKAITWCLREGSLELRCVRQVQAGGSLSLVALGLQVRKDNVLKAYRTATEAMARYLGWEPEGEE